MNIAGLTPQKIEVLPYLLGKDAQGHSNNWGKMPVGTSFTLMFAHLKQLKDGYQGQSFISTEGLYLSPEITAIDQVPSASMGVSIPLTSVIKNTIIDDEAIKMGEVIKITYLGKVGANGAPVNYDNFTIEKYNSPELDAIAQNTWNALGYGDVDPDVVYSVTPDPVKGGELLVVNGQIANAPVAPAPVAPAPVAPAPVAPAPVAPAPVAPAPAPVAPAPVAPAPVAPVAPAPVAPAPVAPPMMPIV